MEIGSGANAHVYYTCHFVGDEFIRLPDVNPSQIKAARNIRRFLTGNLESEVSAYPPFPGKEAEYLRCQVSRTLHRKYRDRLAIDRTNHSQHAAQSSRYLLSQ